MESSGFDLFENTSLATERWPQIRWHAAIKVSGDPDWPSPAALSNATVAIEEWNILFEHFSTQKLKIHDSE